MTHKGNIGKWVIEATFKNGNVFTQESELNYQSLPKNIGPKEGAMALIRDNQLVKALTLLQLHTRGLSDYPEPVINLSCEWVQGTQEEENDFLNDHHNWEMPKD